MLTKLHLPIISLLERLIFNSVQWLFASKKLLIYYNKAPYLIMLARTMEIWILFKLLTQTSNHSMGKVANSYDFFLVNNMKLLLTEHIFNDNLKYD